MQIIKNSPRTAAGLTSIASLLALVLFPSNLFSQGCIIARGGGGAMIIGGDGFLDQDGWLAGLSYRYFHSDRHFVGDQEQPQRQELDTQVENFSNFLDVNGTYAVTKRFWLNLTVPFVWHERSSLYEHDRTNRYSSFSGGLGDVRLTTTVWLLAPETHQRGNFALGAGLKAPTGDYTATDTFHRPGGPQERPVDSSIQPGDGGWGAIIEGQGFFSFTHRLSAYGNGFYLINPRELIPETNYSVPDGYMARAGLNFVVWPAHGLSLSLGARIEGVPATDLFGGNLGFRRPGYSVGIEPGITWVRGRYYVSVTAPVAVYRNRVQSYPESLVGRHGDAAFADYSINATFSVQF